jgi:hypothetical protein
MIRKKAAAVSRSLLSKTSCAAEPVHPSPFVSPSFAGFNVVPSLHSSQLQAIPFVFTLMRAQVEITPLESHSSAKTGGGGYPVENLRIRRECGAPRSLAAAGERSGEGSLLFDQALPVRRPSPPDGTYSRALPFDLFPPYLFASFFSRCHNPVSGGFFLLRGLYGFA